MLLLIIKIIIQDILQMRINKQPSTECTVFINKKNLHHILYLPLQSLLKPTGLVLERAFFSLSVIYLKNPLDPIKERPVNKCVRLHTASERLSDITGLVFTVLSESVTPRWLHVGLVG